MSSPVRARRRRAASRKVVPGGLPSLLIAALVATVLAVGVTREPVRDHAMKRAAATAPSAI